MNLKQTFVAFAATVFSLPFVNRVSAQCGGEQTVTLQANRDAFVSNHCPQNLNIGYNVDYLFIGTASDFAHGCQWGAFRSYLGFDLTSIPSNATIESAILTLSGVTTGNGTNDCVSMPNNALLYQAAGAWTEESVSWTTQPNSIGAPIDMPALCTPNTNAALDVTAWIRDMVTGRAPNNGFVMKVDIENNNGTYRRMIFASREWAEVAKRPTLTIRYHTPTGNVMNCDLNMRCHNIDSVSEIKFCSNSRIVGTPIGDLKILAGSSIGLTLRNNQNSPFLMSDAATPVGASDSDPNVGVLRSGIDVQLRDLTHTYGGKTTIRTDVEFGNSAVSFTGKAAGSLASASSWHAGGGGHGIGGSVTLSRGTANSVGAGGFIKFEDATLGSTQFNGGQRRIFAGTFGQIEGTITSIESGVILAGVYGFDSLKRADTWAGYFQGKGKFSDKVVIGDVPMVGNYKLFVEGGVLTEKVKVAVKGSTAWADYVFEKAYQLRPLSEVATFIQQNKHLPDVPSAQIVAKEGLDVAEMMKIQMQKIEELTLYIIQQQQEIEALKVVLKKNQK